MNTLLSCNWAPDYYMTYYPVPRAVPLEEAKQIQLAQLQYSGYCPVTFADVVNNPNRGEYDGLVKGDRQYMVKFDTMYYTCSTADAFAKFLR